jgi:CxxC motif-containing protein (DUF1111 family)
MFEAFNRAVFTLAQAALLSLLWAVSVSAQTQVYTADRSKHALTHVRDDLSDEVEELVLLGRSFFKIPWVEAPAATSARDGLGPLFNANTCVSCHEHNGAGGGFIPMGSDLYKVPRSSVVRLHHLNNREWQVDPVYGNQLSINGIREVPYEASYQVQIQPDEGNRRLNKPNLILKALNYGPLSSNTQWHLLRAPALAGMALIESIPADQIRKRADPNDVDQDGISGRTVEVWSRANQRYELGRYNWKNTQSTLRDQIANAAHVDMGLRNSLYPEVNCSPVQTECLSAYRSGALDLPDLRLQAMALYLANLKAPKINRLNSEQKAGMNHFSALGCQQCHTNDYTTLMGEPVPIYSDLLLHDMGEGLAGSGPNANEWRTAPLIGLGLRKHLKHPAYLHDGRASTLHEAILWHGGEAELSQRTFTALSAEDQQQLIQFLETL